MDDVQIETADIVSKFKFFETFKPSEKEKRAFRITPPRDGVEKVMFGSCFVKPSRAGCVLRKNLLKRFQSRNLLKMVSYLSIPSFPKYFLSIFSYRRQNQMFIVIRTWPGTM